MVDCGTAIAHTFILLLMIDSFVLQGAGASPANKAFSLAGIKNAVQLQQRLAARREVRFLSLSLLYGVLVSV